MQDSLPEGRIFAKFSRPGGEFDHIKRIRRGSPEGLCSRLELIDTLIMQDPSNTYYHSISEQNTVANGTLPGHKYICSPLKSKVSILGFVNIFGWEWKVLLMKTKCFISSVFT